MRWTEKEMCKHFGHLEDHQYKHFNRALGIQVKSKEHFKELLEKGNYIPYEQAQIQADKNREKQKYTGISEKKKKFLHNLKGHADKKGNLEWSDGFIRAMKEEAGLDYSYYKTLPKYFQVNLDSDKGGF